MDVGLPKDVEVYTVAEVAKHLRVSKMTVYRALQSGELPSVKLGDRTYRIPVTGLQAWKAGTVE